MTTHRLPLPKPLAEIFQPPPTPGVLGVFAHLDSTLEAIKKLRAAGTTDFTVYSPIPRHEIEDALGQAVSPVRMFTLIGGIAGCSVGAWITLWMSGDWPVHVGGNVGLHLGEVLLPAGIELHLLVLRLRRQRLAADEQGLDIGGRLEDVAGGDETVVNTPVTCAELLGRILGVGSKR